MQFNAMLSQRYLNWSVWFEFPHLAQIPGFGKVSRTTKIASPLRVTSALQIIVFAGIWEM